MPVSTSEEPPGGTRGSHAAGHGHDPKSQPADCVAAVLYELADEAVADRGAAVEHAEEALHAMEVELDRAQRLKSQVERDRVRLARTRQAYSDVLARHPLAVSWSGQPDGTWVAPVPPQHLFNVGDVVAVVDPSRDIVAATVVEATAEHVRVRLAGWTLRGHRPRVFLDASLERPHGHDYLLRTPLPPELVGQLVAGDVVETFGAVGPALYSVLSLTCPVGRRDAEIADLLAWDLPEMTSAQWAEKRRIAATFTDGLTRTLDCEGLLTGLVFEPLRSGDDDVFASFVFDAGTVTWPHLPGEPDIAPSAWFVSARTSPSSA